MAIFFYNTEIGTIGIEDSEGFISRVYFKEPDDKSGMLVQETHLIKEMSRQLEDYISGKIREFSVPVKCEGTSFMKQVWDIISEIPYGKTLTYGQIAAKLGKPKAARAVGLACNRNPVPIIVPCHRVVGSNGKMTGYAGGLELKESLLSLEGHKRH